MNNLENLQPQQQTDFIEQERETMLRLGYTYLTFKSKFKKNIARLKRQITSYHF